MIELPYENGLYKKLRIGDVVETNACTQSVYTDTRMARGIVTRVNPDGGVLVEGFLITPTPSDPNIPSTHSYFMYPEGSTPEVKALVKVRLIAAGASLDSSPDVLNLILKLRELEE